MMQLNAHLKDVVKKLNTTEGEEESQAEYLITEARHTVEISNE